MKALIKSILFLDNLGMLAAPECGLGQVAEQARLASEGPQCSQPQIPNPLLMCDGCRVTTRLI